MQKGIDGNGGKKCLGQGWLSRSLLCERVFVVSKSDGGSRTIANLKHWNRFLVYRKFKMEGISNLREILFGGEWLTKIDLKDAYFSIPVNAHHQPFLPILFENQVYQFSCLPFGLSSAPWAFTKIFKPVVVFLRGKGFKLIVYLDDFLLISSSRSQARRDFLFVVELLESLGFVINKIKSSGEPSQSREFLGLLVDSRSLTLSLKKEKVEKMILMCRKLLSQDEVFLWELSSVMGSFAWAISSIPFAQAHYRRLQHRCLIESTKLNFSAKITLDNESRVNLTWCRDNLTKVNGKPLFANNPDITIFSDASLVGWGRYVTSLRPKAHGLWKKEPFISICWN